MSDIGNNVYQPPPLTLRAARVRWPWLLPGAVALAVVLGVLAGIGDGRWLVWDEPITRLAVDLRTPAVDRLALWVSRLGSTPVVLLGGLAGILLAARRSRAVALVMLVTVLARPPIEFLLKELVARSRPSGDRLVPGTGYSYPTGHVLAAAATWGFVPVIAALYIKRRWIWWALTAMTVALIGLVAWCRVWLGVHWTTDVVGALVVAFLGLSLAEAVLRRWWEPVAPQVDPADALVWTDDEGPALVASGAVARRIGAPLASE